MKTALVISTIGFLAWGLQLSLWEIPKLEKQIVHLKSIPQIDPNENLAEELKEKEELLNVALAKIKKLEETPTLEPTIVVAEPISEESEPEPVEESDNSHILAQIEELQLQKASAQETYTQQANQLDSIIQKGQALLSQHLAVKPEFKEGNIRTSDADRRIWQEEHDKKSNYFKTEISKLEADKLELKKKLDSFKAQIDLQILQLRKEIK